MIDPTTSYQENGYWIEPEVLSQAEVEIFKEEILQLLRGERGDIRGLSEDASGIDADTLLRRHNGIYNSHKISELVSAHMRHPRIIDLLQDFVSPNVKCLQSMIFMKPPGKPGQAWHQDEVPLPTRDRSLIGVWIAIDDADVGNGGLWVHPGSHRAGVLYERVPHDDPRYDGVPQAHRMPHAEDEAVPVELKAGSALFFHGHLLHRSLNNTTTDRFRRALVFHYMSAESFFPQGGADDVREIIMVRGTDPYAWKGVTDNNVATIRGG
jgi:ectoine hydroxylase-related dioxygenase (phytanoyl-CoA dioxygenase family)